MHLVPCSAAVGCSIIGRCPRPSRAAVQESDAVQIVVKIERYIALNPGAPAIAGLEKRAAIIERIVLGGEKNPSWCGCGDATDLQVRGQRALDIPLGNRRRHWTAQPQSHECERGPR